jgi:hypothetical protein
MSGQHRRSTHGRPDRSQTATEAEATETATVIAGLRARLRRLDLLEHPVVLTELHKLEEQVTVLLDQADRTPGKHRSPTGEAASHQISDAHGFDLKPDPLAATTAAEFIESLQQYRAWSGNPSWRKMAARAGQAVVHSTMHAAMHADTLPKFDVMKAIVTGCGGSEQDLKAFATAWRRIESRTIHHPAATPKLLTAPPPAIRLLTTAGHT